MGDEGSWWSSGSGDLVVLSLIGVGLEGGLAFGGMLVHPDAALPFSKELPSVRGSGCQAGR